ncbi:hypothetical protein [Burkholderia plantarii]|nr:hypothetical protein [Burkholderia plantarii]
MPARAARHPRPAGLAPVAWHLHFPWRHLRERNMRNSSTTSGRRTAAHLLAAASLAALFAASGACAAQPAPGAAPPGPAMPPAAAVPPPPPGVAPAAPLDVTVDATVTRFVTNPDGDIDGLVSDGGLLVRFSPRLGARLAAEVRAGDRVRVSGTRDGAGNLMAQRIVAAGSGRQFVDPPPADAPPPPPREARGIALSRLSVQGRVAHVTTAPRGEPDGVVLADGAVIKLTPPVAQRFAALLQPGADVAAQGYGTRNRYGTALQATAFGAPDNLTRLYDDVPPAP